MKQCLNCGANNDDFASFCNHCGQSLAGTAGEYKPIAEEQVAEPGAASRQASTNPATLWLVLNIVGAFFFCCMFPAGIIHIVGIVFASQASSAYSVKNYPLCENKTNTARILFIVGAALGAALLLLSRLGGLFGGVFNGIFDGVWNGFHFQPFRFDRFW